MAELATQSWRFLLVGGANTLVTMALLALLARVMDPGLAYTLVFALGLAFSTVMTSRYVFSSATSARRMALFVGWYLGVYTVGLLVVRLLDGPGRSTVLLAVVTVLVTAPLSFLGGRLIFHRASGAAPTERERV